MPFSKRAFEAVIVLAEKGHREAQKLFGLFNNDVEGAVISFKAFEKHLLSRDPAQNVACIYQASCFVCATKRAGRMLELLVGKKSCFVDSVAQVIRLEYRKKKGFFGSFTEARDAIEHIDGEARDKTKWSFFDLSNRRLTVSPGKSVMITKDALAKVISARDAISEAIIRGYS